MNMKNIGNHDLDFFHEDAAILFERGPASSRTELICFSAAWVQIVLVDRDVYKPMVGIWKMKEDCNLQLRNLHGIDKDLHILLATRVAKKIGHKSSLTKAMIEQYPCLYLHHHHLDFASDAKGTSSKDIFQYQHEVIYFGTIH